MDIKTNRILRANKQEVMNQIEIIHTNTSGLTQRQYYELHSTPTTEIKESVEVVLTTSGALDSINTATTPKLKDTLKRKLRTSELQGKNGKILKRVLHTINENEEVLQEFNKIIIEATEKNRAIKKPKENIQATINKIGESYEELLRRARINDSTASSILNDLTTSEYENNNSNHRIRIIEEEIEYEGKGKKQKDMILWDLQIKYMSHYKITFGELTNYARGQGWIQNDEFVNGLCDFNPHNSDKQLEFYCIKHSNLGYYHKVYFDINTLLGVVARRSAETLFTHSDILESPYQSAYHIKEIKSIDENIVIYLDSEGEEKVMGLSNNDKATILGAKEDNLEWIVKIKQIDMNRRMRRYSPRGNFEDEGSDLDEDRQ